MKGGISNVFGNFEETKNAKQNAKIAKPSIIHFRRTPAVVRSHTKLAEGQYETNKLLLDLSQRISLGITKDRNGNKISPTVPPKYITYQMLYNECLDNRQTPPITNEEKDKLKMTFKNDKNYPLLNNSIGVKILLNKSLYELERVKWWCDWYKMMKGRYTSGISGLSQLSGRMRSTSLRKAKTYGGVSGAGARRFSPSMTSRERQERQERQNEERIQRQYRLLIPIRNGLLYAMRCFGNVAYSAATFIYWATSLIMDSNDIDVIHDTNEEVRQEYARRRQAQSEDNARRQAKEQEDLRRQRQEQYERTQRPPEYYEEKFANAQRNVREKSKGERKQEGEKIRQNIFEKELNDLQKRREQAEADRAEQEARQREIEIEYQEIMYIMKEVLFKGARKFTQQHYDDAAEERRRRKQAGIRIPWDTAQSPPRAATRATQAAQAPSAMSQGLPAMNDDLNLGTLEEWDAIYKLKIKWDDIKVIKSKIGKNNNTIASVMLYLYLRNNLKDTDAISKLTRMHFGYQSIDALIADFKRHIFNNAYASIGEDFFKIKDVGSNVYSISRITLLRQRLNRVFFFLARNHKCNYVGYTQSRGEGYDYANEIGLTDDEFKKILASSDGVNIPNDITKLHKKMLRKVHSDKANAGFNLQNDSGFPFIRYMEMYDNFLKWYEWYKTNPSSYINEEVKLFCPVNNNIDWDEYEEGKLHANRFKMWFD
jgi:hypothetical protein